MRVLVASCDVVHGKQRPHLRDGDLTDEAKAALAHCTDPRLPRIVAECAASKEDGLVDRAIANHRAVPHLCTQLVDADDPLPVLHEVEHQPEHQWLYGQVYAMPLERESALIQHVVAKPDAEVPRCVPLASISPKRIHAKPRSTPVTRCGEPWFPTWSGSVARGRIDHFATIFFVIARFFPWEPIPTPRRQNVRNQRG